MAILNNKNPEIEFQLIEQLGVLLGAGGDVAAHGSYASLSQTAA